MNIRRQLALSNLMMILIPVLAAILALIFCLAMLWFVVHRGSGMGVDDESDFNWLARMSVSYVGDIKLFRKTDVSYSVSSGDIFSI